MPRGPTVGEDDDDDGFELGSVTSNQSVIVGAVLFAVLGAVALALAASAGVGFFGHTEVTTENEPGQLLTSDLDDNGTLVVVAVVEEGGQPVTDGEVTIASESAQLSSEQTARIGDGTRAFEEHGGDSATLAPNEAGFWFSLDGGAEPTVDLAADQSTGELSVTVHPPPDADYADKTPNPTLLVVRG